MKKNHAHRFRRHVYDSGHTIFFCTLPDCTYKIKTELTLGKLNICNRCGKEFEMNEYSIRLAKPHCNDCQRDKGGKLKRKETNAISVIGRQELTGTAADLRKRLLSTIGEVVNATKVEDSEDLL